MRLGEIGAKVGVVGVVGETDGPWLIDRLESRGVTPQPFSEARASPPQ